MAETGDRQTPSTESGRAVSFTEPSEVERRVRRNIVFVIVIAATVSAVLARRSFTLGLALGGALALLNFKWLHASLRAIFEEGDHRPPPGAAMKFIFRWIIIGAVVYVAASTGYFNPIAIIAGLFAPAFAAMIEAGYVTCKMLSQDHGER